MKPASASFQKPLKKSTSFTLLVTFAAAWAGMYFLRIYTMRLHCQRAADACRIDSIFLGLDRLAVSPHFQPRGWADSLSFVTQDLSGVLAFAVPLLIAWRRSNYDEFKRNTWILLHATTLNGFCNEVIRALAQRPRPFVYLNAGAHAGNPDIYTSFYSGHSSFSALAVTCLILSFRRSNLWNDQLWPKLCAAFGIFLVLATALLRVLSGRHFPTDVIFGVAWGSVIAHWVSSLHPKILSDADV